MRASLARLFVVCVLALVAASPALAQDSATSSITGTVVDTGGGVIPGATAVATSESGAKFQAVTNSSGVFTIPALAAGTYKVTVSLSGFKTAEVTNVRVVPNVPASLQIKLEVGTLNETITVESNSLIATTTPTVSSTLSADELLKMPMTTRNALNAVTFLPGVNTPGINRDATINGLPQSMINITMDGVSNQDNFLKTSDGFFASVYPRQDAVEAVTVNLASNPATTGGSGAVTINFQTRSGTNRYTGSVYEYFRSPALATNAWVNERVGGAKNDIRLNQYGFRFGGPLVLPGVYDGRGKAFFFTNYEQLRFPNSFTRTRTVHPDEVLDGWYVWEVNGETRRVNVLDLAQQNGQISTIDPTAINILRLISNATKTTGVRVLTSDPLIDNYVWQSPGNLFEQQPTVKLDYNITSQHRLSGSVSILWADRKPDYLNSEDRQFPGAPNWEWFRSKRPLSSMSLRSTLSSNLVNEFRVGITALGGASKFGQPDDPNNGPGSFADIGGSAVVIPLTTDWFQSTASSWRSVPTFSYDDTINWQKGSHSLTMGAGILHSGGYERAQTIVQTINLGFNTANDPAAGLFTQANFPGGDLADARAVYALLTGRISSITGQAALDPATNQYVAFGPRAREGYIRQYSAYLQDSWRASSTLTITGGLRYDLQTPFQAVNDTMSAVSLESICGMSGLGDGSTFNKCDFFGKGNVGVVPEYVQLTRGTHGYNTDTNNLSPNIGVAWRPNVQDGFLRKILGDPETATLRAGFSVGFERQGLGEFTGQYGANPGSTLTLTRSAGNNNLVLPGETWPILLSQPERIYQASFPTSPTYPIAVRSGRQDSLNAFAPDVEIGYARTWSAGFQRSISRDMAVDIRYVGTRGVDQWSELNYNTRDLESNGFHDEFLNAMNNLRANNAAGGARTGSFAYFGPGTGTAPLPIYLAYINSRTNAGDPAAYTGTTWTNTGLTNDMVFTNPSVGNSAADLDGDATRRTNAIAAGLPANFFVVNPDVNAANVIDSGAFSDYHALQIDVRRRLSKGLLANVNYQYAIEGGSAFLGFAYGRVMNPSTNVRHAIKTQWNWTVPVGRGQRFGTDMHPVLDAILGGWDFNGVGRVQAVMVNFGNVRLVGMTQDELQAEYKHRRLPNSQGIETVFMLPDDIIQNTRRAFSVNASSLTGYGALGAPEGRYIAPANGLNPDGTVCVQRKAGDCAPRTLLIRAPWFTMFDVGIGKRFPFKGSSTIEVRVDILNVFDNINFNNAANPGTSATQFQVTSAYSDASNTYNPGGRLGQIMARLTW